MNTPRSITVLFWACLVWGLATGIGWYLTGVLTPFVASLGVGAGVCATVLCAGRTVIHIAAAQQFDGEQRCIRCFCRIREPGEAGPAFQPGMLVERFEFTERS